MFIIFTGLDRALYIHKLNQFHTKEHFVIISPYAKSFKESVKHLYHFLGGLWAVLEMSDETLSRCNKQHIDKRTARFCQHNPHKRPWQEVMFAQVWAYVIELTLTSKLAWMWGRKTISSSSHSCLSSVCIRPLILHLCRPNRINTYVEVQRRIWTLVWTLMHLITIIKHCGFRLIWNISTDFMLPHKWLRKVKSFFHI